MKPNLWQRCISLAGMWGLLIAGHHGLVRPWHLSWGATEIEIHETLPGDGLVPVAGSQETRAITINANVADVWPWIAQLGQDRGGFYSYDLIENLVGCEMPTVDTLHPDKQTWKLGDKLWMYPPTKGGGIGFATLREFIPGRALVFGTHAVGTPVNAPEDGSWAFVLESVDNTTTRLIVRGRVSESRSLLGTLFDRAIFDPMHFVMERRMMIGIQQQAEGHDRGHIANHMMVGLFTIALGLVVMANVMVLQGKHIRRSLIGFFAAGVVFQILTFVQPHLVVGAVLILVPCFVLWSKHGLIDESRQNSVSSN